MQEGPDCSKPLISVKMAFFSILMTIMMTLTTKMMILMILVYRHCGVIGQERVGGVGEADNMV